MCISSKSPKVLIIKKYSFETVLEVVQSMRINDEKLELQKENQMNEDTNDGLLNDILEELKVEKDNDNDIERRQKLKNAAGALLAKEFKRKMERKEDINDIKLKMVKVLYFEL